MGDSQLTTAQQNLADTFVPVFKRVYDINAARHDPLVGDDGVTFGSLMYRNSWFQIEQALSGVDGWSTARPDGSLTITHGDQRYHVYSCGPDEAVDVDAFRLDDASASLTKRAIVSANSSQMRLALEFAADPSVALSPEVGLNELVIIHAGNPDDGCCAVWVGAALAVGDTSGSPWASIVQLWCIERSEQLVTVAETAAQRRHDQMPEPDLDLRLAEHGSPTVEAQ